MVKIKYLAVLVFVSQLASAQTNRYMVFFNEKDTALFNSTSASDYLSDRAITRRSKQDIQVTIQDFPVTKSFLSTLSTSGADVFFTTKWMNGALVEMDESLVPAIESLEFVTSVEFVAPGARLEHNPITPQDPATFTEPGNILGNTSFQLQILNADNMHEDGYQGDGMLIGVFDDGFEGVNVFSPFQDLWTEDRIVATRDFIRNSGNVFQFDDHGTCVLSTIGARYEATFSGTAPEADFVLCVTEDISSEYRIEEYNWLIAAEYADSIGVDVINSSLGYSTFSDHTMDYEISELDGNTAVVTRAANILSEKGVIISVSAGNEGRESNSWRYIVSPGDAFGVLTVGSVKSDLKRSDFSSVGPTADGRIKPDVCALGSQTAIVDGDGDITTGNGTSFASPQIAGFAAGIWQANPTWSSSQVMEAIRLSASNSLNPDTAVGFGIPNYNLAVTGSTLSVADIIEHDITVYPNPFTENSFTLDLTNFPFMGTTLLRVIDANGRKVFQDRISERDRLEKIEIPINESSGTYFLILENKAFSRSVKLVKI